MRTREVTRHRSPASRRPLRESGGCPDDPRDRTSRRPTCTPSALHSMSEPDGHRHWYARYEGGPRRSLGEALRRWCGTVDATDQDLLDRSPGAVLDAGCGPGRLVIELGRQGRQAVGLDTSRVAVRLARSGGATALCRSIFDPAPGEGRWDTVLLADGNVGIGGDPAALLARCRDLIGADRARPRRARPPGHGAARRPGAARARRPAGQLVRLGTRRRRRGRRSPPRRPGCASPRPGSGPGGRSPHSSRLPSLSVWRPERAHPGHRRRRFHRVARRRRLPGRRPRRARAGRAAARRPSGRRRAGPARRRRTAGR